MTFEQGFMWFSLALLIGASIVSSKAMKLLDEAKVHADRWGAEREAAESLRQEAIIIFRQRATNACSDHETSPRCPLARRTIYNWMDAGKITFVIGPSGKRWIVASSIKFSSREDAVNANEH